MTTLVALNTMDALVMGCDSLGTVSRRLVDPFDLTEYFDLDGDFKARRGEDGEPLLTDFMQIYMKSQMVPYDHMTYVDKLFSLHPLPMGVMFAGLTSLGQRTIKSLVEEFKVDRELFPKVSTSYTVQAVGQSLLKFLRVHYEKEYPTERSRPDLELIVGGYDKGHQTPCISRVHVHSNVSDDADYDLAVYFGAQAQEIQRLVFGTDPDNKLRINQRSKELLARYHGLVTEELKKRKTANKIPPPDDFADQLRFIADGWDLDGLTAGWHGFSVQNSIDCVDFLVNIMVESQRFKSQMPSVGGPAQIAVIRKQGGFKYVSRREWRHGDHAVMIEE